jgi:hypothetical protein
MAKSAGQDSEWPVMRTVTIAAIVGYQKNFA